MSKKGLAFTALMITGFYAADAQFVSGKNEIGLGVGAFIYQGDLAPGREGSLKTARPSVNIYYNRILNSFFSLRGNLSLGSLAGDDSKYLPEYRQYRNFRFHSRLAEVSGLAVFNIFGNNSNSKYLKFSPYVFAGAGLAFINARRDYSNLDLSYFHTNTALIAGLALDSAKKLPRVLPVIPLGIGLKYAITPSIGVFAEGMYRYSFSDYIDGFSYSASAKYKDSYYSASAGVVFNFGKNLQDCPRVQ